MTNLLLPYANNKGADQPAHPRSLISVFVARCLDSIVPLLPIAEISSLYLASVNKALPGGGGGACSLVPLKMALFPKNKTLISYVPRSPKLPVFP